MTIEITIPTDTRTLYHQYQGQNGPQGVYLELDPNWTGGDKIGRLYLDWNGEIGNAVPMRVWHGVVRRYHLPAVPTLLAAQCLIVACEPAAQRVIDGLEVAWDGNNHVGRLSDDASEAEMEITQAIEALDSDDYLQVWEAHDYCCSPGISVEDFGLSPYATEAQIEDAAIEVIRAAWQDEVHLDDQDAVASELRRLVRAAREDADEAALEAKWDEQREMAP